MKEWPRRLKKMISAQLKQLNGILSMIEMTAFLQWQKLGPKKRDKFCEKLGRWEANLIIKEINKEAKDYARRNIKITESNS